MDKYLRELLLLLKELTYSTFQPSEMSYYFKGERIKKIKGKQTTKIINLTVYINIFLFLKQKLEYSFVWSIGRGRALHFHIFFFISFIFDRVNNRYSTKKY